MSLYCVGFIYGTSLRNTWKQITYIDDFLYLLLSNISFYDL
jgi:hypothetical protein